MWYGTSHLCNPLRKSTLAQSGYSISRICSISCVFLAVRAPSVFEGKKSACHRIVIPTVENLCEIRLDGSMSEICSRMVGVGGGVVRCVQPSKKCLFNSTF